MKKIKRSELIARLEERVEHHHRLAVEKFQNYDEQFLLAPGPDGSWSIAQCLWHLNSYGEYYLPEIGKRVLSASPARGKEYFKSTWFGSYFTRMMEPTTGKRRIKAFKNHVPDIKLDAHAVVAEFIYQQEDLLNLLSKSKGIDLNKIRIPISIASWFKLKLGDVFQFLIAHDERHIQQISRIIKYNENDVVQKTKVTPGF